MRRELLAFKLFQCLSGGSSPPLSTFIIAFLSSLDLALCYIEGGLILARTHLGMGPGKVSSSDWDHTFPFSGSEELCQVWYFITARGPRRRQWHLTPVLLPGKSHGRRSLVGCSPWGREESDTTERLHFHFSLSCTGEGNGGQTASLCGAMSETLDPIFVVVFFAVVFFLSHAVHVLGTWSTLPAGSGTIIWI